MAAVAYCARRASYASALLQAVEKIQKNKKQNFLRRAAPDCACPVYFRAVGHDIRLRGAQLGKRACAGGGRFLQHRRRKTGEGRFRAQRHRNDQHRRLQPRHSHLRLAARVRGASYRRLAQRFQSVSKLLAAGRHCDGHFVGVGFCKGYAYPSRIRKDSAFERRRGNGRKSLIRCQIDCCGGHAHRQRSVRLPVGRGRGSGALGGAAGQQYFERRAV